MNGSSYELVTTQKLTELISSGKSVYAFEPNPLWNSPKHILEKRVFQWRADITVDLDEAKARLGIREDVMKQLPSGKFTLYKANIVGTP